VLRAVATAAPHGDQLGGCCGGPVRRVGLSPFWIDPVVVSNARLTSAASALSGPVTISTTGKGRTRISARPG
jgi:hypothetical protein